MRRLAITMGLMAVMLTACSEAVTLTHEHEDGGVVTYVYKPRRGGHLFSPHRAEALELAKKKCPAGYVITREGEIGGASNMLEGIDDDPTHRRWGMQFRCKSS